MDEHQDLVLLVGKLDGKMDLLLTGMTTHFAEDKKAFAEVHKKIDGLKSKWAFAAGATAVVTFIVSNSGIFQSVFSMLPK